jgi:hypothetical protein
MSHRSPLEKGNEFNYKSIITKLLDIDSSNKTLYKKKIHTWNNFDLFH